MNSGKGIVHEMQPCLSFIAAGTILQVSRTNWSDPNDGCCLRYRIGSVCQGALLPTELKIGWFCNKNSYAFIHFGVHEAGACVLHALLFWLSA
jgi:hypothetical protein